MLPCKGIQGSEKAKIPRRRRQRSLVGCYRYLHLGLRIHPPIYLVGLGLGTSKLRDSYPNRQKVTLSILWCEGLRDTHAWKTGIGRIMMEVSPASRVLKEAQSWRSIEVRQSQLDDSKRERECIIW